MKRLTIYSIFFLIISMIPQLTFASDGIPDKVLNNFQESFPTSENVHWHVNKNYVEAYFTFGKSSCRVDYSPEGDLLVVIYYLTPDLLRKDITTKIESEFPGKEIFGVTETIKEGKSEYIIVLKDNKNWYYLKYTSSGKIKIISVLDNTD